MISGPTNSNPVVIEIRDQIHKIMQSNASRKVLEIKITGIFETIVSYNEEMIEKYSRRETDLLKEKQDVVSILESKNEEIQKLINRILELNKENSSPITEFENTKRELTEAYNLLEKVRSELEDNKQALQNANQIKSDLEQKVNESSSQCEIVSSQLLEIETRQASDSITTQKVSEDNANLQTIITNPVDDRNNLIDQLIEKVEKLTYEKIKLLAEQEEIKRLKKAFIEYTLVRSFFPDWPKRVEDEFAKKGFFFTYLNPLSSTPWLDLCDQQSLRGREHNITKWLMSEKKKYPHLTELQALTQLLRRINYGCLIRDEEEYIKEYKALHSIK